MEGSEREKVGGNQNAQVLILGRGFLQEELWPETSGFSLVPKDASNVQALFYWFCAHFPPTSESSDKAPRKPPPACWEEASPHVVSGIPAATCFSPQQLFHLSLSLAGPHSTSGLAEAFASPQANLCFLTCPPAQLLPEAPRVPRVPALSFLLLPSWTVLSTVMPQSIY